ncbi:uncharacterized protein LOC126399490 [Epinephelus moara]|uniref:uncharacterized protein LOC126399490 n=1 Tax=Epinephelus moara TaxID=300413 RepID=UPI00214F5380|nr:uncharacterized protein LOC126399490 [Epinephelus moara]
MILCLLFPVLILGNVESQTANVTGHGELNSVEGNQTFTESSTNNSTMIPANVTYSLYKDEMSLIEVELQNNQTSTVITEDDEDFQEQEKKHPGRHCQEDMLVFYSYNYCGAIFDMEMSSISKDNWCVLENILRPYSNMTFCLESISNSFGCYYPNSNIQDFFLHIHSSYFFNCSKEELPVLVDAPQWLVIILTLIPVSLIPVLVYLVVLKSNIQE